MSGACPNKLELWAGVECSVVRIGDQYRDQLVMSGHDSRLEDLELFHTLGVKKVRYPILWERTAPHSLESAAWEWCDARLARLRELRIEPIVGLVHHGSGPRYASLEDPDFPEQFSAYCELVACRYPWLRYFAPVNEPLTTARFAGLYGHWYPHARNDRSFVRCLYHQIQAARLGMKAIRRQIPEAIFVQTEDLGTISSTSVLEYQAEFENHRRWLSWDLLMGRVTPQHPLWDYLIQNGIESFELSSLSEDPCPPDLIGINHYVTSDRYLDERIDRYPGCPVGGNGIHRYVDIESVRVDEPTISGLAPLLREAWERYGVEIAITEAHLGGSRDEQIRWLKDIWDCVSLVRQEGAHIRAVTAWSLLGSYDWNSLLTRFEGRYESGVFDVSNGSTRPTAIFGVLQRIARGEPLTHFVSTKEGWWKRPDRFLAKLQPAGPLSIRNLPVTDSLPYLRLRQDGAYILLTGGEETLGAAFAKACESRALHYRILDPKRLNLSDAREVERILIDRSPFAVIHAAGFDEVDAAEKDPHRCYRENVANPAILAAACGARDIPYVSFSTDLVFPGDRTTPYTESDPTAPLNVYGKSKAEAEAQILQLHPSALILRMGRLFGSADEACFVARSLLALRQNQVVHEATDRWISPTYLPDFVNAALDLLFDGESGIWHLTNPGTVCWSELAKRTAVQWGLDPLLVHPMSAQEIRARAPRPNFSALTSERGILLPPLTDALRRYLNDFSRMNDLTHQRSRFIQ